MKPDELYQEDNPVRATGGCSMYIITMIICIIGIVITLLLSGCEKEPGLPVRGTWSGLNPNYNIQMTLAQFDITVKGNAVVIKTFSTTNTYETEVTGECIHPYINLQFQSDGYRCDFRGELLDRFTMQGKLDGDLSITFIKH